MKTAFIIGILLVGGLAWGAASGASRAYQSGAKKLEPILPLVNDPDGYFKQQFPWTYGTYATARDYWYGTDELNP